MKLYSRAYRALHPRGKEWRRKNMLRNQRVETIMRDVFPDPDKRREFKKAYLTSPPEKQAEVLAAIRNMKGKKIYKIGKN